MAEGQARQDLDSDEKLRLAPTHLVELVGEAASQVPASVRKEPPEVPWAKAIAMRHRLVHGYDIFWDTITRNLPGLVETLDSILGPEF